MLSLPHDAGVRQPFWGEMLLSLFLPLRVEITLTLHNCKITCTRTRTSFHPVFAVHQQSVAFPHLFWHFRQMLKTQEVAQNVLSKLKRYALFLLAKGCALQCLNVKALSLRDDDCYDAASLSLLVYGPTPNYRGGQH